MINNSSQNMNCEMGWAKHPWKGHVHNKQKPGKSPAFTPLLPALPTLLAVAQPCYTSNVRNSRGSSIAHNPDPLPGIPQQLLHPRVVLRCNREKPGSCSGQHKSELAQRTKILLWLTSSGSHTPALQQQLWGHPSVNVYGGTWELRGMGRFPSSAQRKWQALGSHCISEDEFLL